MSTSAIFIAPSIAAGNILRLQEEVEFLEQAGADAIHIDVMDGHFVPHLTLGVPFVEQIRKITKLPLDVHIMVTNPDETYNHYLDAGADTLTFHIETVKHAYRLCEQIRAKKRRAGVALNPATHWNDLKFLLPVLDVVLVMAVSPGFSRQKHIASMQEKIRELHEYCLEIGQKLDIEVDGGVGLENIHSLAQAGARWFVAGGAVFNGGNPKKNIEALREAALRK